MGRFRVAIEVGDPTGARWETVETLVDSGSAYTWVPSSILERLDIATMDVMEFEMADGSVVARDVGETLVRIDGRALTTLVVFADDGSTPLELTPWRDSA